MSDYQDYNKQLEIPDSIDRIGMAGEWSSTDSISALNGSLTIDGNRGGEAVMRYALGTNP
jgi:hypothetical protein